jgi:hypothetical protein
VSMVATVRRRAPARIRAKANGVADNALIACGVSTMRGGPLVASLLMHARARRTIPGRRSRYTHVDSALLRRLSELQARDIGCASHAQARACDGSPRLVGA